MIFPPFASQLGLAEGPFCLILAMSLALLATFWIRWISGLDNERLVLGVVRAEDRCFYGLVNWRLFVVGRFFGPFFDFGNAARSARGILFSID